MIFFPLKFRWLNITAITVLFLVGYLIAFKYKTTLIFYIAVILFPILGFEYKDDEHYLDSKRLKWYSKNYFSSYYRLLFSFTYVLVSFVGGYKISLDFLFFLAWYVTLSAWWYLIFFFPRCGVLDIDEWWKATIAMPILIVCAVMFIGWIIINVSGVTFFSEVIMDPINLVIEYVSNLTKIH